MSLDKDMNLISLFIQDSAFCRKIPGLNDALAEIKEFISLFVSNDFDNLKKPGVLEKKYSRLDVKSLPGMLEKFKESKGKEPKQKVVLAAAKKLRKNEEKK